jgi:chromosome segregation ATPase
VSDLDVMARRIVVATIVIVLFVFGFNYIDSNKTQALVAEERVRMLEAERIELEEEVEEAVQNYELLRDSLDQVQDSLAEVREQAENDVLTSSVSFEENLTILRDSLDDQSGLEAVLDTLESNHLKVVEGYETQVASLEWDKQILLTRVESLDSLWVMEQRLNESLRNEIAGLNEASAAWKSVANRSVFRKVTGAVPYVLAGVALGSLFQD